MNNNAQIAMNVYAGRFCTWCYKEFTEEHGHAVICKGCHANLNPDQQKILDDLGEVKLAIHDLKEANDEDTTGRNNEVS